MENICNFSGGRSSAYMINFVPKNTKFIFCNTSKETPETYEFIKECINYFKIDLIVLEYKPKSFKITDINKCKKNGEIFEDLINYKKFMPNVVTRFCTTDMKINVTKRFLKSINIKNYINYLGIRADEPQRYSKIISRNTKYIYNDMPLFYNNINKTDVNNYWKNMPFDLKHDSILGNCDLCFLKGKNKIINILKQHPEKADWWITQEQKNNHTFKKDISYKEMLNISKQDEFNFNDEQEILCNCNLND